MAQQNPIRGFLISVGVDPEIKAEFQYNPDSLTDRRSVDYTTLNAPGIIMPVRQYNRGGDRTISFTVLVDGLFDGPSDAQIAIAKDEGGGIGPELNKYRAFLYPAISGWKQAGGSFARLFGEAPNQFAAPPLCRFGFGDRVIDCVVTEVNITETLFNPNLAPLRAEVSVTLVERTLYGNEPTPPPGY